MKKILIILGAVMGLLAVAFSVWYGYGLRYERNHPLPYNGGCTKLPGEKYCTPVAVKPVIYLYPEKATDVQVTLAPSGKLLYSYPDYDNGWDVVANSNGSIINKDGKEYSYLFWEAEDKHTYDLSTGFVVKGEDSKKFLQEKLSQIGLTPKEYNEMIVYWYPRLERNKYNLIHFAGKEYTDRNQLIITPKPDSLLRVYLVSKPLDHYIDVPTQEIKPFARNGFTVIEWGGQELK